MPSENSQTLVSIERALIKKEFARPPREEQAYVAGLVILILWGFIFLISDKFDWLDLMLTKHTTYFICLVALTMFGVSFFMLKFGKAKASWIDYVDAKLVAYEPINKDAFRKLQHQVSEHGWRWLLVQEWLDVEKAAVEDAKTINLIDCAFIKKKV